ncbi:type VI secretion system lipoprotein TssJ [Acidisoma sp. C75]
MKAYGRRTALLVSLTALSGCFGPSPTTLNLTVDADPQLNPSNSNAPSPMVLKFFELTDPDAFEAATFNQLFYSANDTLKSDLLNTFSLQLVPGQKKATIRRNLTSQTAYLGIVAGYRQINNASWRLTRKINMRGSNRIRLVAGRLALSYGHG